MMQLFINNFEVVVNNSQSIKLFVENQYFSQSDTYTYEVSIPLNCSQNRRFFGHINRRDVKKQSLSFPAKLYSDGKIILDGKAKVLSISDSEMKVQLLGAASAYVSNNNENEIYIDELDLGNWSHFNNSSEYSDVVLENILSGEKEYVMYPVENSTTGNVLNFLVYKSVTSGGTDYRLDYSTFRKRSKVEDDTDHQFRDSYQPMLWYAVKLIAEATGRVLADEDNYFKKNILFKRIFIATAYSSQNKSEAFPHWTVNDWWHNIEQAFGVVVVMDEASNKMKIEPRNKYYNSAARYYVEKVEDSFTADLDDETTADLSISNVGFEDHDNDPYEIVDQEVIKQSVIDTQFDNLTELVAWAQSVPGNYDDNCNKIFKCKDGHEYILAKYIEPEKLLIYDINQFGPRITDDTKDTELQIKFVPCKTVDIDVPVYQRWTKSDGSGDTVIQMDSDLVVRAISRPERDSSEPYTEAVEDLIEGGASNSNESKPDVCYIALLGDYDTYQARVDKNTHTFTYPRAHTRDIAGYNVTDKIGSLKTSRYSLSLKKIRGVNTLYSESVEDSINVDVKVKQCFKFLANNIPNPASVFVIENKTYLCRQLEVDITTKGMSKLITGYFYEVKL